MIGIIYNPLSRKGQNRHRVEDIRKILDERGIPYEYRETEAPMDGIRVGREMSETCDVLIAVGGDGTVNEVVNGAKGKNKIFGILPFGSGNDISRSLHVYEKTDEELADMIATPSPRTLDCGVCRGESFMLFLSFGIVAKIIQAYTLMKRPGKLSYPIAVLKAIFRHKPENYKITVPGRTIECYADFVSIQNTPTAGGGLYMYKPTVDNDGHMDLIIVNHTNFGRLILNAFALFSGKIHLQPNVEVIPVTQCTVEFEGTKTVAFDGELRDYSGPVEFEMGEQEQFLV